MSKTADATVPEDPAPPPGILIADYFTMNSRYHVRRRKGTLDWLLTFTMSGHGIYRIGDRQIDCHANDVVILLPNVPHDYRTAPETKWNFYWAHFIPHPRWLTWLQSIPHPDGLMLLPIDSDSTSRRLGDAFQRLLTDSRQSALLRDELAHNALEEIILLLAAGRSDRTGRGFDPRVEQLLSYFEAHLDEPVSIRALAHMVSMSESGLAHLFKAEVGISPIQMLIKMRLQRAAKLLQFTTLSVQQVAADLGFQNPFHFSKQFKAWYGLSPRRYREEKGS